MPSLSHRTAHVPASSPSPMRTTVPSPISWYGLSSAPTTRIPSSGATSSPTMGRRSSMGEDTSAAAQLGPVIPNGEVNRLGFSDRTPEWLQFSDWGARRNAMAPMPKRRWTRTVHDSVVFSNIAWTVCQETDASFLVIFICSHRIRGTLLMRKAFTKKQSKLGHNHATSAPPGVQRRHPLSPPPRNRLAAPVEYISSSLPHLSRRARRISYATAFKSLCGTLPLGPLREGDAAGTALHVDLGRTPSSLLLLLL